MMSYSNESYTSYNNKNDALTCNSRPICSTLQNGKYGSQLQNVQGTYYDYGNSSCGGDFKTSMDLNACYQKLSNQATTSDYTAALNDNLLYGTTQTTDTVQEDSMSEFLMDPGGANYGSIYSNAYNGRLSAVGDGHSSKILPQAPLEQNSSMLDGMYTASGTGGCGGSQQWQQGFRASQQATPPVARSRMLPHPTMLAGGVVANDYAKVKRQRPLQQLNGFESPQNYINAASVQAGSGNVRILPQPHAPLSKTCDGTFTLKRHHFQDTMNRVTTSTPNYSYDKMTINQDQDLRFNNSGSCDIYSWAEPSMTSYNSTTFDVDNFCPLQNQQRPHTSMAPFNYYRDGDDYVELEGFADDNLSTYSDTPIAWTATSSASLSAAAQQKLQQQRKLSLMMAMTTASVIASGETRIAPNKKKQQAKSTSSINKGTENMENLRTAKYSNDNSRKHDTFNEISLSSTVTPTVIRNNINYNLNQVCIATPSTTVRSSESLSAATSTPLTVAAKESCSSLPTTTSSSITQITPGTVSVVVRPTRARKLPKCLPTIPKSRKISEDDNATRATTTSLASNNKVLPKLPVRIKSNNNLYEKDCMRNESITTSSAAPTKNLVTSPTNLLKSVAVETTAISSSTSTSPVTTTSFSCNSKIVELSGLSQYLDTPDLSNNNSSANINNNTFDYFSNKANSNIDDHKISSKSTMNAFNNAYSTLPLSTSQTTSASLTKAIDSTPLSPISVSTSTNIDYLDYLKSYNFPKEDNFKNFPSSSNEINMVTLTSTSTSSTKTFDASSTTTTTTPIFISNTMPPASILGKTSEMEKDKYSLIMETSTGATDNLNKNVKPPVTTAVPETMIDYSAYINSLTTTIATSLSPPLQVFSSVTESLVPLEASTTLNFSSNTYFDSLSNSSSSSKFDDIVVAKTIPVNNSSERTNDLDNLTILPSTYPTSDITTSITKITEDTISNEGIFTESYADYLKKFELPDLPPLLTATENNIKADTNSNTNACNTTENLTQLPPILSDKNLKIDVNGSAEKENQQPLPSYVTGFLNGDYSGKYEFLSDYKINDLISTTNESNELISETTLKEESSRFSITSPSTISTAALQTPLVTTATNKETKDHYDSYSEYLKHDNENYASKYDWNVDDVTLAPVTSAELLNDAEIGDIKETSNEQANFLPVSTSISTAFDDSFYDSFRVDLDTLTAEITSDEQSSMTTTITTTAVSNNLLSSTSTTNAIFEELEAAKLNRSTIVSDKNDENVMPTTTSSSYGGYYRPPNAKPLVTSTAAAAEETLKAPSSTASAASKATSLIGGLSKGLKGSLLDGVLTGVGATATAAQQPQQPTAKKGFGFNLASKLVPNVGGLLAGSSGSKSTTKPDPISTISVTTTSQLSEPIDSSRYIEQFSGEALSHGTEDFLGEGSYDFENRDEFCDVDYNNQQLQEYSFGMQNTDITGTADYDEYGVGIYSEYEDYNMANVYAVESEPKITTEISTTHQHSIGTIYTTATSPKASIGASLLTTANAGKLQDQPLQQQQQQQNKTEAMDSKSGGGMFGSFLGKAAAAMQSATQVVNQGAAAIVQQHKTPATTAIAMQVSTATGMTTSTSVSLNNAYSSQQEQQEQHDSLLSLQTYSSTTTAAGNDYENSNMVAVYNHQVPISGMNTNNYYSNGNQSQPPNVSTAKILPAVPAVGKKLPNITNGSKSGIGYLIKQQPTEIYDEDELENEYEDDKSPNYLSDNSEHSDYYQDVAHSKDLMPNKTANLNGYYEQHHNSGGYDYREDYFDEEDEYKYLEREAEAEQERLYRQQHKQLKLLNQQQKQSSSLEYIEESQNEIDDEVPHDGFFIDDNYPSEDSGNYLDESSSGSVGGVAIKSQRDRTNATISDSSALPMAMEPPNSATRSSVSIGQPTVGLHQQIKKQDSIIMEENDKIPASLTDDIVESPVPMMDMASANNNSKAAFRRKSSDILIDDNLSIDADIDDQLGDLPETTQRKKKVLIRGETEEVVSGNMQILKRQKPTEVTSKQRWHWAYNKIIMQLNVSRTLFFLFIFTLIYNTCKRYFNP